MGAVGTSNRGESSGSSTVSSNVSSSGAIRQIERATFKNEGGGNWQFDIEGVGGGQVLDESDSNYSYRAGYMPGTKLYSISAWAGPNYETIGNREYYTTLNEAKRAIKDRIISYYGGRG